MVKPFPKAPRCGRSLAFPTHFLYYRKVDFAQKFWQCPICFNRNQFPAHYAGIPPSTSHPQMFLFVIIRCALANRNL